MPKTLSFLFLFIHVVYCQTTTHTDSTKIRSLIITSDPTGANIYLDNSLRGKTPMRVTDFPSEKFSLKLISDNQSEWLMNYSGILPKEYFIHALINKDYGLVQVFSEPTDSDVYVNDTLISKTPSGEIKVKLGLNKIRIEKINYEPQETFIKVTKSSNLLRVFNIKLETNRSVIDFAAIPNTAGITIDNRSFDKEKETQCELSSGEHYLSIKSEKIMDMDVTLLPNTYYQALIRKNQFIAKPFLLSTVLPGLGQFSDGSELKGLIFFSTVVGLGVAAYTASNNYNTKVSNYNSARNNYLSAVSEIDALASKDLVVLAKDEMNVALKLKQIFLASFACSYLINIIDVLLYHSFKDIIALNKVNNKIILQNASSICPTDVSLTVRIRL